MYKKAMNTYVFPFEKLLAWKKAKELVKEIYLATESFPREEIYGLTAQIRRSAVSVASNLAEGTSRSTQKDQFHFTVMAFSSLMEMINQLIISEKLGFLDGNKLDSIREKTEELSRILIALRKSQQSP